MMVWVWAFCLELCTSLLVAWGYHLSCLCLDLFTCRLVVEKGRVGRSVARFVACIGYRQARGGGCTELWE